MVRADDEYKAQNDLIYLCRDASMPRALDPQQPISSLPTLRRSDSTAAGKRMS